MPDFCTGDQILTAATASTPPSSCGTRRTPRTRCLRHRSDTVGQPCTASTEACGQQPDGLWRPCGPEHPVTESGSTSTRSPGQALPPVGRLLHLHPAEEGRLLPPGAHQCAADQHRGRRRMASCATASSQASTRWPTPRPSTRPAAATTASQCGPTSRARSPSGPNVGDSYASQVSVAGWRAHADLRERQRQLGDLQPDPGLPNAAGKSFTFEAFDFGDATCSTVGAVHDQGQPSARQGVDGWQRADMGTCLGERFDASGTLVAPADHDRPRSGPASSTSPSNQRQALQRITVQIPSDYGCDQLSPGGCWYPGHGQLPAASVNDTTTWDATIDGDVVRLVQ